MSALIYLTVLLSTNEMNDDTVRAEARSHKQRMLVKCKKLGLETDGTESDYRLACMIEDELTRRYYIGAEATFEEQFDHLLKVGFVEGVIELDALMSPGYVPSDVFGYNFGRRFSAAIVMYVLTTDYNPVRSIEEMVSKVRELGIMLVGPDYYKSHPESPFEAISKLREAKMFYLINRKPATEHRYIPGMAIMDTYFSHWEFALDSEALALY